MALGQAARGRRTVVVALGLLVMAALVATGCSAAGELDGGSDDGSPVTVRAQGGTLQGTDNGTTRRFHGIRYAEAPVGARRWAAPVPAGPWDGTRPATRPGPVCPQTAPAQGRENQNEDCLFLNVTTPSDVRPGERLPVLVWWHGGGYVNGSGSEYDAQRLAAQGRITVVTVNYRLGTLGYLGLPGLPGSGAFGFADQVLSLRWTRDNIAAFGGDPDAVTVAGESAGGASTCALLGSPALRELAVKRVVVMSGSCSARFPANGLGLQQPARGLYTPVSAAQAAGQAAATALRCTPQDALSCLRAAPITQLLGQSDKFDALAYGGDLLPGEPAAALPRVPPSVSVMYGGMHDEGRAFFARIAQQVPTRFSPEAYDRLLAAGFGPEAGRVREQYPLSRFRNSGAFAWATVVTDRGWSCAADRDQQTLAAAGVPTYAYEFSRPDGPIVDNGMPAGGAAHATELPLLFDRPQVRLPGSEQTLSEQVIGYWSSFVRTGRPEAADAPPWTPVPGAGPVMPLRLDPRAIRPVDAATDHRCDFWSTVR